MGALNDLKKSKELSSESLKLIKNAARENGIQNFEIECNTGSQKGDNFMAEVLKVNVKDKNSDKTVSLILKVSTLESLAPTTQLFIRESEMYIDVVPKLLKIQSDANISNPFTGIAKCYGSCLEDKTEAILMEDLFASGYKMWNKRYPMEDDHVALVFSEYAKFHSISLAVKEKNPEKFTEWKTQLASVWGDYEKTPAYKNVLERAKASGMEAIKNDNLRQRFDATFDYVILTMQQSMEDTPEVITHGDSWCNNMMFAYDGSTVKKVCLIDWQLAKVGTPIWDLAYFFHVCASKQVLYNYKKYLALYHKILSENLKEFGCDVEEILSYDTLLQKWSKLASLGLYLVLMLGKVMMCDADDIPDDLKDQLGEDFTKSFNDVIVFDGKKQAIYEQRISDVVQYMLDHEFLKDYKFPKTME